MDEDKSYTYGDSDPLLILAAGLEEEGCLMPIGLIGPGPVFDNASESIAAPFE